MANAIDGLVTSINENGDLITDITAENMAAAPRDVSVSVVFGAHETVGIFAGNHGEPDSTLIAVLADSGFLEIGIVGMSIHEMLQINVGEKITVKW